MDFFKSQKKKEEKQRSIARFDNCVRECANQNRISQIKHIDEYFNIPVLNKLNTIVMAKICCKKFESDSYYYQTNDSYFCYNVILYDTNGKMYTISDKEDFYTPYNNAEKISLPIDGRELMRVILKIIPFFIISENDNISNKHWLSLQCWNYGSKYDTELKYSGKKYLFVQEENYDSSIKSENDIFVRKYEIPHLSDNALMYLSEIISVWENKNLSEIAGDYDLWKEKKDFILSYKYYVNEEILKRNLKPVTININEQNATYGEKGEESVEYALKWLPNEYKTVEKGNGIYLRDNKISEERQEIDHITVGPNGVFVIETKYLKGNISIDSYKNWKREIDGVIEGLKNPIQQTDRHHMVIASILEGIVNESDIHDIICLAYDSCTISGIENSPIMITKSDMLCRNITNSISSKKYTKSEINEILNRISQFRIKE